jgi:DedD protein
MNPLLDEDDELDRDNHEVTLSTGMILGIFFGLVLLCGLFFGFGYKMGNHKPAPAEAASAENEPSPTANFGGFKPAAGSPAGKSASAAIQSAASEAAETSSAADVSGNAAGPAAVTPVVRPNPTAPSSATSPVALTAAPSVAAGSFIVQVAAVSHQEDAELLVNALKAKGYPVSAHTEPQDKFFHVQVGPFNNRNDADAAKQRLLADGYQPIVK